MRARVDARAQQRAALRARERVEVVQRRRVTARRLEPRGGGGVPARAQRVARVPDVGAAAALTRDDLRGATAATTTATTGALGGAHPQPRIEGADDSILDLRLGGSFEALFSGAENEGFLGNEGR